MSSRPDPPFPDGDPRAEDYLDHLTAPLVGVMPYPERAAWREEVRLHLDALVEEFARDLPPDQAIQAALREFGDPWQIGQAFAEEWQQGAPRTRLARLAGVATLRAFACFGLASMVNLLALETAVLGRSGEALTPYIILLAVVSPLVAGCTAGAMIPAQAGRAVARAMVLLILHSLATGLLLLPQREGLGFALFQAVFWLSAGSVSAEATASLLKGHRRQRFLSGTEWAAKREKQILPGWSR